jgi:ribosomal protein L16 Arg81 hydroxylase
MEIGEFNRDVRERCAAKFESALPPEELEQLYSLSAMESLLKSEAVPVADIDIFHSGHLMRLADVQKKSGKSSLDVVVEHFRRGSTIRIRDIDKCESHLKRFTAAVQRYFAAQSQVNLYLTPPGRNGFPPHFDITDVFIVQCAGRKEWKLYHQYTNKAELPGMETNWDPDLFQPSVFPDGVSLNPGDVLYLPRGVMHEAYCENRESLHLTVSLVPLTFAGLIAKALASVAEADIEFRRRVPWSVEGEDAGIEAIAGQARARILELADRIDVNALLEEERGLLQTKPHPVSSGALESAIASLVGKDPR